MASDGNELLVFACTGCTKRLKAPPKAAGKRVKCPKCGMQLTVPSAAEIALLPAEDASQPVADSKTGNSKTGNSKTANSKTANSKTAVQPEVSSSGAGSDAAPRRSLFDQDDPFQLDTPAIADLSDRQHSADEIKAEKDRQREQARRRAQQPNEVPGRLKPVSQSPQKPPPTPPAGDTIPFDSEDFGLEPATGAAARTVVKPDNSDLAASASGAGTGASAGADEQPVAEVQRGSLFDADLPDLEELKLEALSEPPAKPRQPTGTPGRQKSRQPSQQSDADALAKQLSMSGDVDESFATASANVSALDDLLPELDSVAELPSLMPEEAAEYRVTCKTCGTAQYIAPSTQGMKIKCPDCYSSFKAPPPPKDWSPTKKKKPRVVLDEVTMPLSASSYDQGEEDAKRRNRTSDMLSKAEQQISDEEMDRLYDGDFDTAGFVQRTFGFLRDPVTMIQVFGYGIVFAGLFAVAQVSAMETDGWYGRGMLLLSVVLMPMIGILFALPMLSGGLMLIEAVANKQTKVREFPVFNIFDNAGEMILIGVALMASVVPGYFFGLMLGGEGLDGIIMRVTGMMLTCFVLFPIFLLSMLDNNSLFQPISGSVMKSLASSAEAWGGYYLKTMIAFFFVTVSWYVLLGKSPVLAAIAGSMVPLLVFFTCQQIGALADAISDALSFEFTPASSKADDEEDEAE